MEREISIHRVVDGGPNSKLVQMGVVGGLQDGAQDGALRFVKLEGLGEPLGDKHLANLARLDCLAASPCQPRASP